MPCRRRAPGDAGQAGGPASSISGSGGVRFKAVDQILEVIDEVRVVEVRLVAGERDDLSVAFGCVVVVAFGLVEPAKTLVAVMHGGEACQHLVGGPLGPVRFPGAAPGEPGLGPRVPLVVAL